MNDDDMLNGFIEEAREHLSTIEPDLLALEKTPGDMDIINRLFRSVHSIKGGAGFFGLEKISALSHVMENLMSLARSSKIVLTLVHIDALLAGLDLLIQMLDDTSFSHEIEIEKEVTLIEQLGSGNSAKESSVIEVQGSSLDPKEKRVKKFSISEKELTAASKGGRNIYAVSVSLKQDLIYKGKTPSKFITELETIGHFIDSYLDIENAVTLETCVDGELEFVFLFSTIMDPILAINGLGVPKEQVCHINLDEIKAKIQTGELKNISQGITKETGIIVGNAQRVLEDSISFDNAEVKEVQEIKKEVPKVEKINKVKPILEEKKVDKVPVETTSILKANTQETKPKEIISNAPVASKQTQVDSTEKSRAKIDESIRVSVGKLNKLVDLAGELVLARNQILRITEQEVKKFPGMSAVLQSLNLVTTELQEEILNTRMQPVSVVFGKFPRLIRELGSQLGKKIELVTSGNEVELDKTVIESLSDPLTHIIRNTADHGIESIEKRKECGKPPQGTLHLKAYHESGQVIIQVKDDGQGINPDIISRKAIEKGVITQEAVDKLTDQERVKLVFLPGFSTVEQVSSVSGRGVGMDVVRSNIERIGGTVDLNSVVGEGTTIQMSLPLTMAIVSCLIVQSQGERFAVPQINLEELVMLKPAEYEKMLGRVQDKDVLQLRGSLVPLIPLSKGLNIPILGAKRDNSSVVDRRLSVSSNNVKGASSIISQYGDRRRNSKEAMRILIVNVGSNKVGIIVDSILGSEEIVVKPMPEYLKHLQSFSGATILGDGSIALILDVQGFVLKNQLLFSERVQRKIEMLDSSKEVKAEEQSLLIFDNATEEQYAITVPMIQRVDEIDISKIQHVGEKEYIEYRGKQMRILRLADYLPVQKPQEYSSTPSIIIPKETKSSVGLLINRVIDTQNLVVEVGEGGIRGKGILGSTLINGRITLLVDLYAILEAGEPESIGPRKLVKKANKKSSILLVEDTPFFLTLVREYLTSIGYTVTTAIDGVKALELLNEKTFDVVLSDIEMPNMDGWGLIRSIRAQDKWKDLPVIALTSFNDETQIQAGKKAGFNDWLVKLNKEKIVTCLDKYIN
ncbi:MAG: two-component system chemotaxis sensor kinase CheA [bacterium]|jgi:two-component system chemotaxis sensor kinase CheA